MILLSITITGNKKLCYSREIETDQRVGHMDDNRFRIPHSIIRNMLYVKAPLTIISLSLYVLQYPCKNISICVLTTNWKHVVQTW